MHKLYLHLKKCIESFEACDLISLSKLQAYVERMRIGSSTTDDSSSSSSPLNNNHSMSSSHGHGLNASQKWGSSPDLNGGAGQLSVFASCKELRCWEKRDKYFFQTEDCSSTVNMEYFEHMIQQGCEFTIFCSGNIFAYKVECVHSAIFYSKTLKRRIFRFLFQWEEN